MFRGAIEPWHIVILVLVVLILFGWKKLPDAARSLGRSARILKSEMSDNDRNKNPAAGQTVPGQTASQPGGIFGEEPIPGYQSPTDQQQAQSGYTQSQGCSQQTSTTYPVEPAAPQPVHPGYVQQTQPGHSAPQSVDSQQFLGSNPTGFGS